MLYLINIKYISIASFLMFLYNILLYLEASRAGITSHTLTHLALSMKSNSRQEEA